MLLIDIQEKNNIAALAVMCQPHLGGNCVHRFWFDVADCYTCSSSGKFKDSIHTHRSLKEIKSDDIFVNYIGAYKDDGKIVVYKITSFDTVHSTPHYNGVTVRLQLNRM